MKVVVMKYGDPDKYYRLMLSRPEAASLAGAAKLILERAGSEAMLRAGDENYVSMESALDALRSFIEAIDHRGKLKGADR